MRAFTNNQFCIFKTVVLKMDLSCGSQFPRFSKTVLCFQNGRPHCFYIRLQTPVLCSQNSFVFSKRQETLFLHLFADAQGLPVMCFQTVLCFQDGGPNSKKLHFKYTYLSQFCVLKTILCIQNGRFSTTRARA